MSNHALRASVAEETGVLKMYHRGEERLGGTSTPEWRRLDGREDFVDNMTSICAFRRIFFRGKISVGLDEKVG